MERKTVLNAPLWMRVTLFVSLAINLLIIGAVVGFVIFGDEDRREARVPRDLASVYTRALDPEDRRALRQSFSTRLRQVPEGRETLIADMRQSVALLRADPFDAATFADLLSRQGAHRAARDRIGQSLLTDTLASLTPEQRADYADQIEASVTRWAARLER